MIVLYRQRKPRLTAVLAEELPEVDTVPTPSPQPSIVAYDNHVYFYADVTPDRCLELLQRLREVDGRLASEQANRLPYQSPPVPIILHIHSYGGEAHIALAVADQVRQLRSQVISIVEGVCASAGTLISMACHTRLISPNSMMLIHQFSSWLLGTYEEMVDGMKYADRLMAILVNFYTGHSKMTPEQTADVLKRDSWFTAGEAESLGLVDGILQQPGQTAVTPREQPTPQTPPTMRQGKPTQPRNNKRRR